MLSSFLLSMPSKEETQDIPVQRVNPQIMQLTDSAHSLSAALQSLQRAENYHFPSLFSQKSNHQYTAQSPPIYITQKPYTDKMQ